jgi:hypothetical protein
VAPSFGSNVPYTIHHDGGSTTVTIDQTATQGQWRLLGTFNLTPGPEPSAGDLRPGQRHGGGRCGELRMDGLVPPTATWTPTLPRRDYYDVQAWWPFSATFPAATDAQYKITGEAGSTTVTMNQ